MLGRSCLAALLTQTWEVFHRAGALTNCTGVVHFANRHPCVTFWTHSCPATGNSKPDSPYQPACVRSVTSGLRSVRLCTASASWFWINGWNVRQKLNLCLLRRHDHTKVTWSCMTTLVTVHDFIFHLTMTSLTHFEDIANNEDGSTCNRCACTRFKTPERPSSYKASSTCDVIN